ncbi:hypothetical protein FACS1894137_05020 [Spirochaetia bacterium]|nr:hypothetical protein FACS1894137_05020 [Spirochaetia bacterium]
MGWYSPPVEERIIDICLLNDYLLLLKKSEIAYIDLTKKIIKENIKHFSENQRNMDKLLKIEDNCLLLNENKYELLRRNDKNETGKTNVFSSVGR